MFLSFKKSQRWTFVVIAASLLFIGRFMAHAQVTVTNPPQGASSCFLAEQVSGNTKEHVGAMVMPDGKIYAIAGSYNVLVGCAEGGSDCSALNTAVQSATAQGNSISGFPQATGGPSNNNVIIQMGPKSLGNCAGAIACEYTTTNSSGGLTANIYVNQDTSDEETPFLTNSPEFMSVIEHEMSHGFGIADASAVDTGLMGGDGIFNPPSPPPTWGTDAAVAFAIQQINAGNVTVGNCENLCDAESEGSVPTWYSGMPGLDFCSPALCTAGEIARGGIPDASAPGGCSMPAGTCIDGYTWNGTGCTLGAPLSCPNGQPILNIGGVDSCLVNEGGCYFLSGQWNQASGECTDVSHTECGGPGQPACATGSSSCSDGLTQAPDGSCQTPGSGDCVDPDTGKDSPCSAVCGDTDPQPSWCASVGTQAYCDTNPGDPACSSNSSGGVDCSVTPDDPSCPAGGDGSSGSGDYCDQYPQDPNCSSLCSGDPSDPSCTGAVDNGGGGDGGGGSYGDGGAGVDVGSCSINDDGDLTCPGDVL